MNNAASTAVFESVLADLSGEIEIVVTAAPGASRFGGLSAMELTAVVPEPGSVAVMVVAGCMLLRRRGPRARS